MARLLGRSRFGRRVTLTRSGEVLAAISPAWAIANDRYLLETTPRIDVALALSVAAAIALFKRKGGG